MLGAVPPWSSRGVDLHANERTTTFLYELVNLWGVFFLSLQMEAKYNWLRKMPSFIP